MLSRDFEDINYLRNGTDIQKRSYEILIKTKIFQILEKYSPILVGTIPIGINIENSDLDIVCKVENQEEFKSILVENFKQYYDFKINIKSSEVIVCNFLIDDIEIEVYGSCLESKKTNGYRHMIIEYKLLNLYGQKFKDEIISLKNKGLKTEPAFAKLLELKGDPYDNLLLLENEENFTDLKYYIGEKFN